MLLVALGTLASQKSKSTANTLNTLTQLLNYCATHPTATVTYHASQMILHIDSDASYLSESHACSRSGGHFYLSSTPHPTPNGAIFTECTIMKHVMASAAEAEVGALFKNGQHIVNNTMKQRQTRAMDMHFYWIKDRVSQGQFHIYWRPGKDNLADYYTKHHPPSHHLKMRSHFFTPYANHYLYHLRGCVILCTSMHANSHIF